MKTLVVGLGNPFASDDSIGLRIARLIQGIVKRSDVTVIVPDVKDKDIDLIDLVVHCQKVILIDSIQTANGKAAQIHHLGKPVLATLRHYDDPLVNELLTIFELGALLNLPVPEDITAFAIEVTDVATPGVECTDDVELVIPVCAQRVIQELTSQVSEKR